MGFIQWLIGSPTEPNPAGAEDTPWEETGRGRCKNILGSYPESHIIYEPHIEVAGISFRKREVFKWADGHQLRVDWEREPDNSHDRNAIMVFGCSERGRWHIGYMPKEAAASVVRSGMMEQLQPRLARIFQSPSQTGDPYCEVVVQITGPRALRDEFSTKSKRRRTRAQPRTPEA